MSDPDPDDEVSAAGAASGPEDASLADILAQSDDLAEFYDLAESDDLAESKDKSGSDDPAADEQARLTAWVQGRVQGVGFRWWVRRGGLELGLVGMAENLTDGRVKVVVEGVRENCAALLKRLEGTDTPGKVVRVTFRWDQPRGGLSGFAER